MAQNKALLRFRARLRSRGYTNIKIKKCINLLGNWAEDSLGQKLWYVECTEPLMGFVAICCVSEPQMNNWPGIPFENCGGFSYQTCLDMDENGGVYV